MGCPGGSQLRKWILGLGAALASGWAAQAAPPDACGKLPAVEQAAVSPGGVWLSTGATRLPMLQATVAFLEKNSPPN